MGFPAARQTSRAAAQRIAVVGCGTAGLAVAAALARDGRDVTLFERFAEPLPLGAGLLLQPTGLACLDALELDGGRVGDQARALGVRIDSIHGRTKLGQPLIDLRYTDVGLDAHGVAIHRGALFGLLLAAARAAGVPVVAGRAIADAPQRGRQRLLVDEAGEVLGSFDLVIDASGMRSALRARCGEVRYLRANPYGAVWCVVQQSADWPHPHALQQRYHAARHMMGLLPIGRATVGGPLLTALFWSLRVRDHDGFRAAGVDAWRQGALSLWPEAAAFVAAVPGLEAFTFATYADIALRRPWAEGIAFIGDAAHTASPQLGQGANLALLDAAALAASLRRCGDVGSALVEYAHARRAHVRFYAAASQGLTPFFQSDSTLAPWLRDNLLAPLGRIPWVRRQMAFTLAGMKTGLLGTGALP